MSIRLSILFMLMICIKFSAKAQVEQVEPYDYRTSLKGEYKILFKVDDELEYLYLGKGKKVISELSSISRGLPYKNLGYVCADFKNYFVLAHSFGAGNPHHIELIKKLNGLNVLKVDAAWIGADEDKEYLLYCKNDVPSRVDKMTLFDVQTGKKQEFDFPKDIFDESQVLNRIEIIRISAKDLVIKYNTTKGYKTKIYNR